MEWHQEVYNINTFAPGCRPEEAEKYFYQIFIALDDKMQKWRLWVLSGSNKLGVLESIDVLSCIDAQAQCNYYALKTANAMSVLNALP